MRIYSHIASWVFLPLFMPFYALLTVLYVASDQDYFFNDDCMYLMHAQNKTIVLIDYAFFGILLPGISYFIMRRSGMITTIEMDDKNERALPIIVMFAYCTVLYVFLTVQFEAIDPPKYVFSLALSGVFVSVAHFFLNMWKKVSIHAGGAGIAFGFLLAYAVGHAEYNILIIVIPILASGLVMTARLFLKKHDMTEVTVGWFLGCLITFTISYLY